MKNKKLMDFRNSHNITIPFMAEKIGVSRSYYEKIEYGHKSPSFNFLTKFKSTFPEADASDIFLSENITQNDKCSN